MEQPNELFGKRRDEGSKRQGNGWDVLLAWWDRWAATGDLAVSNVQKKCSLAY